MRRREIPKLEKIRERARMADVKAVEDVDTWAVFLASSQPDVKALVKTIDAIRAACERTHYFEPVGERDHGESRFAFKIEKIIETEIEENTR